MSVPQLECGWQEKCPRDGWDPAATLGPCWKGNVVFLRVTLCARELQSGVTPKLAPQGRQDGNKNRVSPLPQRTSGLCSQVPDLERKAGKAFLSSLNSFSQYNLGHLSTSLLSYLRKQLLKCWSSQRSRQGPRHSCV